MEEMVSHLVPEKGWLHAKCSLKWREVIYIYRERLEGGKSSKRKRPRRMKVQVSYERAYIVHALKRAVCVEQTA
jgi:hypothetical protein